MKRRMKIFDKWGANRVEFYWCWTLIGCLYSFSLVCRHASVYLSPPFQGDLVSLPPAHHLPPRMGGGLASGSEDSTEPSSHAIQGMCLYLLLFVLVVFLLDFDGFFFCWFEL